MLFSLLLLVLTIVSDSSQQSHMCTRLVAYTVAKQRTRLINVRVGYNGFWGYYTKWGTQVEHYTVEDFRTKNNNECCTGYSLHEGECTPICHGGCINSNCTAPQICTCLKGYVKESNSRCKPYCDTCVHGFCWAPNSCDCFSGYEKDESGICKPKCAKPCHNGICTQPDTCSCQPGYKLSQESIFDCQPICEPPCELKIKSSQCVAPNTCKCYDGYKKSPDEKECLPICYNCNYGDCNAPGQCDCWEGYNKKTINETCVPLCDSTCVNSYCSSPQTCSCFEGYASNQNSPNECQAICEICENGDCIAPEKCNCWNGYEMNINGTCIPSCSQPCENGYCSEPENCACNEGYKISVNDSYTCLPICEGCDYGFCTNPGNCSCWTRYEWNNFSNSCELLVIAEMERNMSVEILDLNITKFGLAGHIYCDSSCLNETTCFESNCYCQFETNFHNENSDNTKYNSTCELGFCDQNVCSCSYGYIYRNHSKCISMCKVDCANGFCIDPNFCECLEGYLLDSNDTIQNNCIPLCNGRIDGCINGLCVNPDVCQCNEGFEQSEQNNFECFPIEFSISESITSSRRTIVVWSISIILAVLGIITASGCLVYLIKKRINQRNSILNDERDPYHNVAYSPDGEHVKII